MVEVYWIHFHREFHPIPKATGINNEKIYNASTRWERTSSLRAADGDYLRIARDGFFAQAAMNRVNEVLLLSWR